MSTTDDTGEPDLCNCSICLVKYNKEQNIPKVYKCGHTFCEACTKKLWNENTKVIKCPYCRSEAKISTIEDLTTNFIVFQILDAQKPKDTAPVKYSIPTCLECAKEIMLSCMKGSEKRYCDGCYQNLQKLAKDGPASSSLKFPFRKPTKCAKHPGLPTKFNCVDPKCTVRHKYVCATCFDKEHMGHTFERIESHVEMALNNFNNQVFTFYFHLKKESSRADVKRAIDINTKGTALYERRLHSFKSLGESLKNKAVELFEHLADFQLNEAELNWSEQESRKRRSSTSKSDTTKRQKLPEEEIDIVQPNQSNVPTSPGSSEFNPITLE